MARTPFKLKQQLSPVAKKAKAERDLRYANKRSALRADSQRRRRKKSAAFLKGKDYDHRTSSFKSVAYNRGGGGNGTKNE